MLITSICFFIKCMALWLYKCSIIFIFSPLSSPSKYFNIVLLCTMYLSAVNKMRRFVASFSFLLEPQLTGPYITTNPDMFRLVSLSFVYLVRVTVPLIHYIWSSSCCQIQKINNSSSVWKFYSNFLFFCSFTFFVAYRVSISLLSITRYFSTTFVIYVSYFK